MSAVALQPGLGLQGLSACSYSRGSGGRLRWVPPFTNKATMRYSRAEYAKMLAAQQEVSRAEDDYQRLREAYVSLAKTEPGNEVGLAMVGADMDRAHAHLQALIGFPRMAAGHEPARTMPATVEEPAEESA